MHRLGDVGAAVVDDHPAPVVDRPAPARGSAAMVVGARGERRAWPREVDEARAGDARLSARRGSPVQALGDCLGDLARVLAGGLGRGERAVALEVGEVGAVGGGHPASAGQARAAKAASASLRTVVRSFIAGRLRREADAPSSVCGLICGCAASCGVLRRASPR